MRHLVCRSEDEVRAAIESLPRPLVAKGVSADLSHKSEHGLVRLNIREAGQALAAFGDFSATLADRKSTRLNSSHLVISYAVFCLKQKTPLTLPMPEDGYAVHRDI